MEFKRVVVTGLGAITPLGNDAQTYWKNLVAGTPGAGPITNFDASLFKTQFACEVKGFEPTDYVDRREVRRLDRFSQFAIASSSQAVEASGLNAESIDKDGVGVIWGSGIGGLGIFQEEISSFATGDGTPRFNPFFIPKMIVDIAAGHISMRYGFRGPNFSTVSACASSTNALIDSLTYLRLGKANAIVT